MESAPHPSAPASSSSARVSSLRARLSRPLLTRSGLVFLMIVIASFGAAVAYWMARTEQHTARLHRQLTLGQMVELSLRQAIVSDLGFRAMLEDRQRAYLRLASSLQGTAERIRQHDATQAGQLDVQAQQENALARIAGAGLSAVRDWHDGGSTEERLANAVTSELATLGYMKTGGAKAAEDGHGGSSKAPLSYDVTVAQQQLSLWQRLTADIARLHHSVPPLAFGVFLFIVALVMLTLADLVEEKPFRVNVCVATGLASFLLAAVYAWIRDHSVITPMGFVAGVYLIPGLMFWRLGWLTVPAHGEAAHPPELEIRRFLGAHLVLRHVHVRREKLLVAIIAFTVLMSSFVGFWYAGATTHANAAAHRAFATEVVLNSANGERWLEARAKGITGAFDLISARVRCALASQRAFFMTDDAGLAAIRSADRDRERDCKVLENEELRTQAKTLEQFQFDSAQDPVPKLMADLYYKGNTNPAQLYALADGYIGLAEKWEVKSTTYILALTLFAIALYLLGQSLGMDVRVDKGRDHVKLKGEGVPATVLAFAGTALAVGTFIHAFVVYLRPAQPSSTLSERCESDRERFAGERDRAEHTIQLAASFYGSGKALIDRAETGDEYKLAAKELDCAVEARPDFARAQYERSTAYSAIKRADREGSYTSFPTKDLLPDIARSLEKTAAALSMAGWSPTPRMLNRQGFNATLLALTNGDLSRLDTAIAVLQRGVDATAIEKGDKLDLDVVQKLRPADLNIASLLYTNLALARLAKGDRLRAEAMYGAAIEHLRLTADQQLVGSMMTDLNILETYCPKVHSAGAVCGDTKAATTRIKRLLLMGGAATPSPGRVRVSDPEFSVRASRVSWKAKFENFNQGTDRFSVVWLTLVPEWNVWRVVLPLFGPTNQKLLPSTGLGDLMRNYHDGASHCLPPGQYRAEFYLNGELVEAKTTKPVQAPAFSNYRSREMNMAFCQPEGWTTSGSVQIDEGRYLMREFKTQDAKPVGFLFTFFASKNEPESQARTTYRQRAWTLLKRWTRSTTTDEQFNAALNRFTGCDQPIPASTILHRSWVMPDGMIHIAFVIGDRVPGGDACQVLESIGNFYGRNATQLFARN